MGVWNYIFGLIDYRILKFLCNGLIILFFLIIVALIFKQIFKFSSKKSEKKNSFFLDWSNKDWIWLLIFIAYTVTYLLILKENNLMNLISYTSTFLSIALAAVAIYLSVREATRIDSVKDEIFKLLVQLGEKINQVDTKINNMDPKNLQEIEDTFKKLKEEVKVKFENEELGKQENPISNNDNSSDDKEDKLSYWVENIFTDASNDLKATLKVNNNNNKYIVMRELKELEQRLNDYTGKTIKLGINENEVGRYEKEYKLVEYNIDYPEKRIDLVMSKNGEIYYLTLPNIREVKYVTINKNGTKNWIYMDDTTWRFYLYD